MQKTMIYLDPEMHERLRYMALDEGIDGRADTPGGNRLSQAAPEKGGAAMRGDGGIYPRGNVLWISYSFRGQIFRESAHTSDEKAPGKYSGKG